MSFIGYVYYCYYSLLSPIFIKDSEKSRWASAVYGMAISIYLFDLLFFFSKTAGLYLITSARSLLFWTLFILVASMTVCIYYFTIKDAGTDIVAYFNTARKQHEDRDRLMGVAFFIFSIVLLFGRVLLGHK